MTGKAVGDLLQQSLRAKRAAVRGEVLPEVRISIERVSGDRYRVYDMQTRMTLSSRRYLNGRSLEGSWRECNAAAEWLEREYHFVYVRGVLPA